MTRRTAPLALALALAAFALAPEALAQSMPWRLSVDRLFAAGYGSVTVSSSATVGGVTTTREASVSGTGLSLFGREFNGLLAISALGVLVPVHPAPRLALDHEFANHLTVGAAAFASWGSATGEDGDGTSVVGFGLAPRVGYALQMGSRLTFWPRVGLSFAYTASSPVRTSSVSTSTTSYTTLSLNIEPTLVFLLGSQFGLTATFVGDVPLVGALTTTRTTTVGGTRTETTTESSVTQLYLGLQFGVTGRF